MGRVLGAVHGGREVDGVYIGVGVGNWGDDTGDAEVSMGAFVFVGEG